MRKRFVFAAAVCILAFPLLLSPSRNHVHTDSTSSAMVALAGHTATGFGWCECNFAGGVCTGYGLRAQRGQNAKTKPNQTDISNDRNQGGDYDPVAGLIFFFVAFVVGIRMRA